LFAGLSKRLDWKRLRDRGRDRYPSRRHQQLDGGSTNSALSIGMKKVNAMALDRRSFLHSAAGAALGLALPGGWVQRESTSSGFRLRLIRNATCVIRYGGRTILLDPFLSDAGALPAFNNTPNPRPNPLVPLPVPAAEILNGIDATLLTHLHVDHWDTVARELLPKGATLFAQPVDISRLSQAGFTGCRAIDATMPWDGITIARTGARHGGGDVGQRMGAVSGYVLKHPGSPTVYIAGDTIWCPEVADAIRDHAPDIIVVNAGEAQFLDGGPIIMGVDDVVKVCQAAPRATVIAVHMEAVNHCVLTRDGLRAGLNRSGIASTVLIPRDGQELEPG
jgi:L-ascorbate metabolism protein UlaG (beta-lactamase superfamily)